MMGEYLKYGIGKGKIRNKHEEAASRHFREMQRERSRKKKKRKLEEWETYIIRHISKTI